jgi:FtsH-binding integral membrane protein
MEDYSKPRHMSQDAIAGEQQRFMVRVYNWMGAGLALTGVMAWFVSTNETILNILVNNPMLFMVLFIAEIGLVFYLAARVMNMSESQAMGVFFLYASLNGITLAPLFLLYTSASLASTFMVTAGMFGAMSFYGYTTKKDLTSWGGFLFMGLVGIIIASIVNLFMNSSALYWIISYAGILIFVGLTAYDTQKIKEMNILGNEGTEEDTKEAIRGALKLYLDFINLFLMLLRVMGDRR